MPAVGCVTVSERRSTACRDIDERGYRSVGPGSDVPEALGPEVVALATGDPDERLADEGSERGRIERLGDVADAAELVAPGAVAPVGARAEEDDGNLPRRAVLAQPRRDLPAVDPRQHHVEE